MSSVALVLTATVDPAGTPLVARTDPNARYTDYRSALGRWSRIRGNFAEIVMIENSAHELVKRLGSEFADVRVISYTESPDARQRGKGYGEALMLERLSNDSALDSAEFVLKCTGRLFCRNIVRLLRVVDTEPDVVVRISTDLTYADSRLFLVRRQLMGKLVNGLKEGVDDLAGKYIEHALARASLRMASEGHRVQSWPSPPFFVGESASTGARYDSLARYAVRPFQLVIHRLSRLNRYR